MNSERIPRAALAVALIVGTIGLLPAPAQAATRPASGDVSANYATAACDPSGPTASDAALASQFNTSLTAKMRGFMTAYTVSCARMVVKAVLDRGLPPRAAVIAITTTIVEASIQNISVEVDFDSLGLFQQRASWGTSSQRLDPTWATNAFLTKMQSIYPNNAWLTAPVGEVCQAVQVSAFPSRYQPEAGDAQIIVDTLWPMLAATEGGPVQFADLDGDLRSELLSIAPDGTVVAYRNLGWSAEDVYDGSQSRTVALGFTSPHRVRFADLTGDGKAELITINPDGTVVAYRNLGWTAPKVYDGPENRTVALGFTDPTRVRFADLNGDGRAELITINSDGSVVGYRNLGWTAPKVYDGPESRTVALGFTDPFRVTFADLSADGRAELVSLSPDGTVVAYRNRGWDAAKVYDGPDSRAVAFGFTNPVRTKLGDLTGDGKADLVTVNPDGSVVAYRNLGWDAVKVFDGPASRIVATGFII